MKKIINFNKNKILLFILFTIGILNQICMAKQVDIEFWNVDSSKANNFINEKIKIFKKMYPETEIKVQNKSIEEVIDGLKTRFTKINLIRCSSDYLERLIKTKKIIHANKVFKKEFFNIFIEEALSTVIINNQIWGVPENYGNQNLLYYHMSMSKTFPEDIDEMIKLMKKLTDKTNGKYGLVYDLTEPLYIHQWMNGYNACLIDKNGRININLKEARDCFEFLYNLKFIYAIVPEYSDYKNSKNLFKNKNAFSIIDGDWSIEEYRSTLGKDLGIALFPKIKKSGIIPYSWSSSRCYVFTRSNNKENKVIEEFVRFMTSNETQEEWLKLYRFPTIKTMENNKIINSDPILKNAWISLLNCKRKPSINLVSTYYYALKPQLVKLMDEEISPSMACEESQKYFIKTIKESKK